MPKKKTAQEYPKLSQNDMGAYDGTFAVNVAPDGTTTMNLAIRDKDPDTLDELGDAITDSERGRWAFKGSYTLTRGSGRLAVEQQFQVDPSKLDLDRVNALLGEYGMTNRAQ